VFRIENSTTSGLSIKGKNKRVFSIITGPVRVWGGNGQSHQVHVKHPQKKNIKGGKKKKNESKQQEKI